ncbi:MAG: hypothetical protein ACYDCO_17560 [Armatimonadota bacterium]
MEGLLHVMLHETLGLLHTLFLLAVIIGSVLYCRRFGRQPEMVLPAFVILLALVPFTVQHLLLRPEGYSSYTAALLKVLAGSEWAVLGICLGLIAFFVPFTRKGLAILTGAFLAGTVLLSLHFFWLVNSIAVEANVFQWWDGLRLRAR